MAVVVPAAVKRGLHRSVVLVLDLGRAMGSEGAVRDMEPTRLAASVAACEHFVQRYRDEGGGGVAQMGICVMRNSEAGVIAPVGSSPQRCIAELHRAADRGCDGETSLQNGLRVALQALESSALRYMTREIVVVLASLALCDPGDVHDEIRAAAAAGVRCSVVALAAELHICALLAERTGGTSTVALNSGHLRQLLCEHVAPPPVARDEPAHLILMGFPRKFTSPYPLFCGWFVAHSKEKEQAEQPKITAFTLGVRFLFVSGETATSGR